MTVASLVSVPRTHQVPAPKMLKEKGLATGDQRQQTAEYSRSGADYSRAPRRSIELFTPAGIRASVALRVSVRMMVLAHSGVEVGGSNGFWRLQALIFQQRCSDRFGPHRGSEHGAVSAVTRHRDLPQEFWIFVRAIAV